MDSPVKSYLMQKMHEMRDAQVCPGKAELRDAAQGKVSPGLHRHIVRCHRCAAYVEGFIRAGEGR